MNAEQHTQYRDYFILIVDDIPNNIKILASILRKKGYIIAAATSGMRAMRVIKKKIPDLILLDIMMPEIDGYDVCQMLKNDEQTKDIPIIFITAKNDPMDVAKGFEVGGVDYIIKPFSGVELLARVQTHLELGTARKRLANQNIILETKVRERTRELSESRIDTIHRLVYAAEYKDPETGSHIKRMSNYSALIARASGLDDDECETVLISSAMHDIGKIGIPDRILLKPGKLNEDEWGLMQAHTEIGAKILADSKSRLIRSGQDIALSHHEKWDGTGYPKKLKGEAIPISGRITALADVFDALTSKRPYKPAWSSEEAIKEIVAGSGTHFDPRLVDIFTSNFSEILNIKERFKE
ncbi:MAG: two-component system response regulator [Desulfobacteraceae bacterium]|nr:two-component system response regulator [Desulfobacteraceae bacterium]